MVGLKHKKGWPAGYERVKRVQAMPPLENQRNLNWLILEEKMVDQHALLFMRAREWLRMECVE